MKWLAALLPYLAVALGLFWIHDAFWALLSFHCAILLSLLLGRSTVPVKILFQSKDIRRVILSILLCGSSGIILYFLWHYFDVVDNLPAQVEGLGLTGSAWHLFIAYFVMVNPLVEEYYWRGYLGSPTRGLYPSDFLYAGFHALILLDKIQSGAILFVVIGLTLTGWFWRQLARADQGLLAPVLGHMAADFTILMAVYLRATGTV